MNTKIQEWLKSGDYGSSSKTIVSVLSDIPVDLLLQGIEPNIPLDAADFGRCLRLVRLMNWEDRLPNVSEKFPNWRRIVKGWDVLAVLYDAQMYDAVTEYLWHSLS